MRVLYTEIVWDIQNSIGSHISHSNVDRKDPDKWRYIEEGWAKVHVTEGSEYFLEITDPVTSLKRITSEDFANMRGNSHWKLQQKA